MSKRLPKKLYKLLRVALLDLRKVKNDPRYVIKLSSWHTGIDPDVGLRKCSVCLAGAVMAKSLGGNREHELSPCSFSLSDSSKLLALNNLRLGSIEAAFNVLHDGTRDFPFKLPPTVEVAGFGEKANKRWWKQMWAIQRMLKKADV